MGLDSYVFADDKAIKGDKGIIELSDDSKGIGYWNKCWFIHSYFADYYQQHYDENEYDFNCIPMQVNQEMLEVLFKEMTQEHLLDSLTGNSIISDYDIEELQKVISYSKSNPGTHLYFHSWY